MSLVNDGEHVKDSGTLCNCNPRLPVTLLDEAIAKLEGHKEINKENKQIFKKTSCMLLIRHDTPIISAASSITIRPLSSAKDRIGFMSTGKW